MRTSCGVSCCTGAICAQKVKDGALLVNVHSSINIVCPPTKESILKIKSYKKKKKPNGVKCRYIDGCSHNYDVYSCTFLMMNFSAVT